MSTVRILLVDDFEPFRRLIFSILQGEPGLQIIGEASDGLEAVQKAKELQPDLIVLDIGLPKISGIEAIGPIRQHSPTSRILMLSQEASPEIAQEAFHLGAGGYVVKSDAARELLPAVQAIARGEKFMSARLAGRVVAESAVESGHELSRPEKIHMLPHSRVETNRRHEVLFYSDEDSLLGGFTRFTRTALRAGSAAIVVATESHRNSLLRNLQIAGLDMAAAIQEGRYVSLDVADVLARILVNDWPDAVRFSQFAGNLMAAASKTSNGHRRRVVGCGECAPFLLSQGKVDAALRLEQLWDELAATSDLDLLCGYPSRSFRLDGTSDTFQRVCAQHSAICSP